MNELAILDAIQLIHTPWLDALVAAYTSTSDVGQIWILLGIVLAIIPKTRKLESAAVLVAVLIGAIWPLSGILKPLIIRPRPCDVNPLVPMIVDRPHGSSFPSGHATAAFAAFGALLFSKGPKPLVIVVGIGALLMALTRLYCYVHYPTDVLAGTVVGLLAGFAAPPKSSSGKAANFRNGDRNAHLGDARRTGTRESRGGQKPPIPRTFGHGAGDIPVAMKVVHGP